MSVRQWRIVRPVPMVLGSHKGLQLSDGRMYILGVLGSELRRSQTREMNVLDQLFYSSGHLWGQSSHVSQRPALYSMASQ